MEKIQAQILDRPQIIFRLARYAHQDFYVALLSWKTEHLRKLLAWYENLGITSESRGFISVNVIPLGQFVDCAIIIRRHA